MHPEDEMYKMMDVDAEKDAEAFVVILFWGFVVVALVVGVGVVIL